MCAVASSDLQSNMYMVSIKCCCGVASGRGAQHMLDLAANKNPTLSFSILPASHKLAHSANILSTMSLRTANFCVPPAGIKNGGIKTSKGQQKPQHLAFRHCLFVWESLWIGIETCPLMFSTRFSLDSARLALRSKTLAPNKAIANKYMCGHLLDRLKKTKTPKKTKNGNSAARRCAALKFLLINNKKVFQTLF